jgi:hypothetical protein
MQRHITAEFDDLQRLHHRDALFLQKTTLFISFVTARRLTGISDWIDIHWKEHCLKHKGTNLDTTVPLVGQRQQCHSNSQLA